MKAQEDLIGQKFGRLTVIKKSENKTKGTVLWLCKCDCNGNEKEYRGSNLKNGATKSCGCYQKQVVSRNGKKYNKYDLYKEYGIGYTSKEEEFYFDLEKLKLIDNYCWCKDSKNGYIVTRVNNKHIFLHRLIMDAQENEIIDHINHIRHDNRKDNLRKVTTQQNNCNTKNYKNNNSGYKGVHWYKPTQKWVANIGFKGKLIYLGYFENIEDAIRVRKEAEIKYFGEYRNTLNK